MKDTAETLLQVQDYKPPRKRRVHMENLPEDQQVREEAYRAGQDAHAAGRARNSSHWHAVGRWERTAKQDTAIAAFELGWDTAARAAEGRAEPHA